MSDACDRRLLKDRFYITRSREKIHLSAAFPFIAGQAMRP